MKDRFELLIKLGLSKEHAYQFIYQLGKECYHQGDIDQGIGFKNWLDNQLKS